MTRFTKPMLLAGSLAGALLLSTGFASAAPAFGHNSHTQTIRAQSHDTRDHRARRSDQRFERGRDGRVILHARYDHARYRNAYRHPPLRVEYRTHAPHPGMHWRAGEWRWQNGQWVWIVGTWLMAAQALSH